MLSRSIQETYPGLLSPFVQEKFPEQPDNLQRFFSLKSDGLLAGIVLVHDGEAQPPIAFGSGHVKALVRSETALLYGLAGSVCKIGRILFY